MINYVYLLIVCFVFQFSSFALAENANFTTSLFSGSGNCARCHDNLMDNTGKNVSIVRDWSASMMANSAKDPFWKAKVASELARNPQLSTLINDKCTRCHAPMANVEIIDVESSELYVLGNNGILNSNNSMHNAAINGVSCTLCHQIADDDNLGTLKHFSGHYSINTARAIYGQYSDIFERPMFNNTGYIPTYSAHISDSALCATCHNLKTPFVNKSGKVLTTTLDSEFPEQMPYTEWQNSIFDDAGSNKKSCQDCHMPETTSKISNRPRWLRAREGFAKHELVGANTIKLAILRDNASELNVTESNFELSISRARAMLKSSANVEIVSASVKDGVCESRVKVNNLSGHKTPTSYPSRRVWINFKAIDNSSNVIFESGRINPDGSIEGADNDYDQNTFEPHYELITSEDQVQIYETIMGDSDGNITYTLLRGATYLKDNRITPQGFEKSEVPADVAVHGKANTDADFNLGSDEIVYRFPVPSVGELEIQVTLNYQIIMHGFLQDLYKDKTLPEVKIFKRMYEDQPFKHEKIADTHAKVVTK